jgi:hypothetical protein
VVEDGDQAVYGEAAEVGAADAGEFGVGDAGSGFGLAGGEAFVVEDFNDFRAHQGFCLTDIGVGVSEICEDVSSAAHNFDWVFGHGGFPSIV